MKYILGIDQSTQGTKALLVDANGEILKREDLAHEQIINHRGWVSHNPNEIYKNTIQVVRKLIENTDIDKNDIVGVGISNQRETSVAWNRETGEPVEHAIVWQCSRAKELCAEVEMQGHSEMIRNKTGMNLAPYFPASKIAWIIQNNQEAKELADSGNLYHGTVDSWLVYKLTKGQSYKTDYSNASRTQLFNIFELKWDQEICDVFGIKVENMAEICDSNACYGTTDFEGALEKEIPIHGVLGDSHGALFGQGCLSEGMMKSTYGTGSSIMMNIGKKPVISNHGVVTSLAWSMSGEVNYVLEGNLNYTGAVITWLKDDMKLIDSPAETEALCNQAEKEDFLYIVPAFSGLGAPYWRSDVKAAAIGMTRTTRREEFVRAGIECIAYQITDIVNAMSEDAGVSIKELRVDGGPTRNQYLMQFQSDIANTTIMVPNAEELSALGAVYATGLALKVWGNEIFEKIQRKIYTPMINNEKRQEKYRGWKESVETLLGNH